MADALADALPDDHPLSLELASLRAAVSRYQHEAHAASLKLQRHSLEAAQATDRATRLERANARLRDELAVLRANPEPPPHSAALQVPELTLALRKLNDKLSAVEEVLLTRTNELADARAQIAASQDVVSAARARVEEAQAAEAEGRARERALEMRARVAEEERRMADRVVQEYADLVRKLEGRPPIRTSMSSLSLQSNSSSVTLVDSLAEGKSGLQKLLEEFNEANERLEAEVARVLEERNGLRLDLEIARKGAESDRRALAEVRLELDRYRADDSTAAKMVSRYMTFSQASTDSLHKAMETLKTRHEATLGTLEEELSALQRLLDSEKHETEKLRGVLDELTEDIAREAFGRRREVALRLAFLGREETLAEDLRRWMRRAREALEREESKDGAFARTIADADGLLEALNGSSHTDGEESTGSVARLLLARDAVAALTQELQSETLRRLETERRLAQLEVDASDVPAQATSVLEREEREPVVVGTTPARTSSITPPIIAPVPQHAPETNERASVSEEVGTPGSQMKSPATARPATPPPQDIAQQDNASAATVDDSPVPLATNRASPNGLGLVTDGGPSPASVSELSLPAVGVPFPSERESSTPAVIITPVDHPVVLPSTVDTPHPTTQHTSIDDTTGFIAFPRTPSPPTNDSSHAHAALLTELANVKSRYDDMQRAFRDCHLALRELLPALSGHPASSPLKRAAERLRAATEDARVELEIRITDEERLAAGYTAMLTVPGALAGAADTLRDAQAFADGSDAAVVRTRTRLARTRDDIAHDIAAIKRAAHELPSPSSSPSASDLPKTSPRWAAWTGGLLGAPPRVPSPAPTFGLVMTSPRLRHASSFSHAREDAAGEGPEAALIASLGLRIAGPVRSAPLPRATPRQRATSGMFLLGLGAGAMRSQSALGLGSPRAEPSALGMGSPRVDAVPALRRGESGTVGDDELDSDLE